MQRFDLAFSSAVEYKTQANLIDRTKVVLPAPCTPLSPTKNGGGVCPASLKFLRWALMQSRMNGTQCCDLSSRISAMLTTATPFCQSTHSRTWRVVRTKDLLGDVMSRQFIFRSIRHHFDRKCCGLDKSSTSMAVARQLAVHGRDLHIPRVRSCGRDLPRQKLLLNRYQYVYKMSAQCIFCKIVKGTHGSIYSSWLSLR